MVPARPLFIAFGVLVLLFGAALWYFQTYAYYEDVAKERVSIAGRDYAVTDFRGIDASTSPLKYRSCFRLSGPVEAPAAEEPTPLVAPFWFDCFDAGRLTEDLEAGRARAYLAEAEPFQGVDRLVAVYDDGRAYEWRQLTPEFQGR